MKKDFINALDVVSLTDVLSAPTKERPERAIVEETIHQTVFNNTDFEEEEEEEEEIQTTQQEPEEPYDAEREATNLINLLNAGNMLVMTPISNFKLRKNRGGKAGMERMKMAYEKSVRGQELTEHEKNLVLQFESYKRDLMLLSGEIPYSPQQMEMLKTAAIPYCEATKFKSNAGFAFWGIFASVQMDKIIKVIQA
jgi:type I site-specific restriction endonuclease